MKLGLVTKLDKRNTAMAKNLVDNVMSTNCDSIVFFPIYDQSAAMRKPDSGRMVYKTFTFISNKKTENRTEKFLTQLSYYCFGDLSTKRLLKAILVLKGIFPETTYESFYNVSSIILTNFRQRWILPLTAKRTPKKSP